MRRHGWHLLFHECILDQLRKLQTAADHAEFRHSEGFEGNANVKLLRALSRLMIDIIPSDPGRIEYRQGNTMGPKFRHWCRAKIGRRFRVFFRYDSRAKVIVFAWINDENTLRSSGSRSDPYAVFQKMLTRGRPPDDWDH